MNKFNGFESWLLKEALKHHVNKIEAEILEKENKKPEQRSIFAPGYFTMVAKELNEKIDNNTKLQKNEQTFK